MKIFRDTKITFTQLKRLSLPPPFSRREKTEKMEVYR